MSQNTPLCISFGDTLRCLAQGTIAPNELEGGVFYPECPRSYLLVSTMSVEREFSAVLVPRTAQWGAYRAYVHALQAAERDNRVAWAKDGGERSWRELNELLESNNLPVIKPVNMDGDKVTDPEPRFNYAGVGLAVREQNLPYDVVWTRGVFLN
jgi:hypothetical protein